MRVPLLASLLILAGPAPGPFEDVTIRSTHAGGAVWVLEGLVGNLGVFAGKDGVLLVDIPHAAPTPEIMDAVRAIGSGPIRFLINTHRHVDHTGDNEQTVGRNAVIVAHDNARERRRANRYVERSGRRVEPSPDGALPVLTFNDRITFHFNGESVTAYHVAAAHTGGDSIVHFPGSNVIHMGDNYYNGTYPLVELSSGGSVSGMIDAVQFALGLCDLETVVIPGHGPLGNCAGLESFGQMLADARERVRDLAGQGMSLEQIIAARPNAADDERLGHGSIKPERFIEFIYNSLADEGRR